jgi:stage V sporulation protein AE
LQSFGLYQILVDFASAGATVPISGFGYLLAKGAMEGAKESLFKAITGGLTSASMGVTAAIVFGYIFSVIFKPKSKRN